jgi:ComF family protein
LRTEPAEEPIICRNCRNAPPVFEQARSFGWYSEKLRRLILEYKFRRQAQLHVPLGDLLATACRRWYRLQDIDVVTCVPLHRRRLRARGFDHTLLLARRLARSIDKPCRNFLKKSRHTPAQSGLDLPQRARNISGSITAGRMKPFQDLNVLLVDDIYTTGATVAECARILLNGGVKKVQVLTLARVELD